MIPYEFSSIGRILYYIGRTVEDRSSNLVIPLKDEISNLKNISIQLYFFSYLQKPFLQRGCQIIKVHNINKMF
jgi:hypothetical protein